MTLTPAQLAVKWGLPYDAFTATLRTGDDALGYTSTFQGSISSTTLTVATPPTIPIGELGALSIGMVNAGTSTGLTITGQLTGPTGGAGTYSLSGSYATTAPTAMYGIFPPTVVNTTIFLQNKIAQSNAQMSALPTAPIIFGDSTANNFADGSWPNYANYGWLNPSDLGVGGDTIPNMFWRFPQYNFQPANPLFIAILAGTNDVGKTNETPAQIVNKDLALIVSFYDVFPTQPIFWICNFPRGDRFVYPGGTNNSGNVKLTAINAAMTTIAGQKTFPFVLINVNTQIDNICLPEFAEIPSEQTCSIYNPGDATHVGPLVYNFIAGSIQNRGYAPVTYSLLGTGPSSRQIGRAFAPSGSSRQISAGSVYG